MSEVGVGGEPLAAVSGWQPGRHEGPDAEQFEAMVTELRRALDAIAESRPPTDVLSELTAQLGAIADRLAPHRVGERGRPFGHLMVDGRGQTMVPKLIVDAWTHDEVTARVTFTSYFLGGGGAAHGGAIPLVFDEVLGRLANTEREPRSRTAYLHVDFRSIARIGAELVMHARFDREEGRKRFLSATLHDGDALVAEAHGLFVALRPGQP
ncbi:MAG TPA: hotdog domain-containing protein [Mycobacteriales bacterium]|nr:hotdog domain-containing protein [Mycobacteriales bacterium]